MYFLFVREEEDEEREGRRRKMKGRRVTMTAEAAA